MESVVDVLYYALDGRFGVLADVALWAPFPLELCVGWELPRGETQFLCKTPYGNYDFYLTGGFGI